MGNVRAKVSANDAVPGGVVLLVKLSLDESGNVLFNVVLFHGLSGNFDGILLHLLTHVRILDDGLLFRHIFTAV